MKHNAEKVTIYWPDYTITKARSADQALMKIGKKQWKLEIDVLRIKKMLAKRANDWTGIEIDVDTDSRTFLRNLGESGMVFVWFGDGDPFFGVNGA